jgi:hypothetical protein
MAIWDRILKSIGKRGFKVRMENEYPGRTLATVDGEDLSIRLREKVQRFRAKIDRSRGLTLLLVENCLASDRRGVLLSVL